MTERIQHSLISLIKLGKGLFGIRSAKTHLRNQCCLTVRGLVNCRRETYAVTLRTISRHGGPLRPLFQFRPPHHPQSSRPTLLDHHGDFKVGDQLAQVIVVRALKLVLDHDQVLLTVVGQNIGREDAGRNLALNQGELGNVERPTQRVQVLGEPDGEVSGFMRSV
jgi:hypothetical protein